MFHGVSLGLNPPFMVFTEFTLSATPHHQGMRGQTRILESGAGFSPIPRFGVGPKPWESRNDHV